MEEIKLGVMGAFCGYHMGACADQYGGTGKNLPAAIWLEADNHIYNAETPLSKGII